jgi:hypothetical protein
VFRGSVGGRGGRGVVEIGHTVVDVERACPECDGKPPRRNAGRGHHTHLYSLICIFNHTHNMSGTLPTRRLPSVLLFSLVPVAAWFVVRPLVDPVPPLPALYVSFGLSIFALLATIYLVPALGPVFVKANLKGRDLLKTYSTPMCVLALSTWSMRWPY